MNLHGSFHIQNLHLHINKELTELYASSAIRTFAVALVAIFEPIYVYLAFDRSLTRVFLYFGLFSLLFGIFSPFGAKILSKVGVKHAMLFSIPFLFLYYLGLWHIEALGSFIYILPIIAAINGALYWPAFHIYFSIFSKQGTRGRQISHRAIILGFGASIAPFVGGIIISTYGFHVLFILVFCLLFSSMVPIFLSKEIKEIYKDSYFESFKEVFQKKYSKKAFAFASEGIETSIQDYIWPIFLFTVAINFEQLGIIASAGSVLGGIFVLYIGKTTDRIGSERMLSGGVILNIIFWPLKMFVASPLTAFLADISHGFGRAATYIPFGSLFYKWAGEYKSTRDRYIILREVTFHVAQGLFFIFLAFVFLITDKLSYLFILAPVVSLGLLFMIKNPKEFIKG